MLTDTKKIHTPLLSDEPFIVKPLIDQHVTYIDVKPKERFFAGTGCGGLLILTSTLCTVQFAEQQIPLHFTGWFVLDLGVIRGMNHHKRFRYYKVQQGLILHHTHIAPKHVGASRDVYQLLHGIAERVREHHIRY